MQQQPPYKDKVLTLHTQLSATTKTYCATHCSNLYIPTLNATKIALETLIQTLIQQSVNDGLASKWKRIKSIFSKQNLAGWLEHY